MILEANIGLFVPRSAVEYWNKERREWVRRVAEEKRIEQERTENLRRDPWFYSREEEFNGRCNQVLVQMQAGTIHIDEVRALATQALDTYMDRKFDEYTGGAYFDDCQCNDDW